MYGEYSRNKMPSTTSLTCPTRPSGGSWLPSPCVAFRRVHRGLDDAGRDGVDPDAARGVLHGQRLGDGRQAALGQRGQRRRRGGVRDLGQGGRDVDHVAAVPHGHLGDDPAGQPEEPGQVHAGDGGVILGGVLGERLRDVHPGVVDQGVDAAEPVKRRVGDPVRGGRVGDVPGHGEQVIGFRRLDLAGAGHHRPAAPAVPGHQAGADVPGASGDDGDSPIRLHVTLREAAAGHRRCRRSRP